MSRAAFGYCRVSSPGQAADNRDGIPRQKEAIRKYAAANGLHISRWFVDSITGKTDLEHRPALQELFAAANGIKVIVIEKLDRVARDLMIQESIVADLKRNGFELVSTMEPDLLSNDPTRILIRQILGAFSQYERSMIVLKLRSARQRARAKDPSRHEGRKAFGHRPGESETIARIVELNKSGMNLSAIANTLNAEERKTRTGAIWYPKTVASIIERQTPSVR